MPLDKKEIDKLIAKLREKYKDYSQKYNSTWFDLNAFDERFSMAIKERMNLEGFILAEITNFEKIKQKYETRKKLKENSFTKEVDRIIEENTARIKKYPSVVFHPLCGLEISHFYGAMLEFTNDFFPVLRMLLLDSSIREYLFKVEEKLEFFVSPVNGKNSKRIEDHILLLNRIRVKEIEIEKDRNDYLKECAFILHEIIDLCEGLMDSGNDVWAVPVTFSKLYVEEGKKRRVVDNFKGLTGYGAFLKIKDRALAVIEDFRLLAFRRMN
ncbi:MAG: hypothetical protein WDA74_01160 [Spirochaetota bacterium]